MDSSDYAFKLPENLIAHAPAEPRDSARLFIYDTKTSDIIFDTFANLAKYLPANSLMILNDTKVVPARLELSKITGGRIRVLFLFNEWNKGKIIKGLPDRELSVGDTLFFDHKKIAQVDFQNGNEFSFLLLVPVDEFLKICDVYGRTPLPPYIDSKLSEEEVRERYQAIFASHAASVAAPTASLHFTENVFHSLDEKGIWREFVTLHVGRGTFAPVTEIHMKNRTLHSEPISINKDVSGKVLRAKNEKRHVIAVGTTAMRLLEATADHILKNEAYQGTTDLFITPPYQFKMVDIFITNFHLPGTSLLMLVDAFLQNKKSARTIMELYEVAIREKFRFYSFGDAMLIL